jgi:hypothetical protein
MEKEETKDKGTQHSFYAVILDVGKQVMYEDGIEVKINAAHIGKRILEYVEALEKEAVNCGSCGGLVPELHFYLGNKTFRLTCFQIEEEKEVKKETNYKQFGQWCQAYGGDKNVKA